MNKTLLTTSVVALGAITLSQAFAKNKVVYGEDNRIETYQASKMEQKLAHSTAGMINTIKTIKVGNKVMLPPYTIEKDMGLCKDERFAKQPSSVVCSGFLVGPDLLVTAGHCIQTQKDCNEVSWVFDYKETKSTKRTDILVPAKNVYKCKKVIEAKLESTTSAKIDYALVRLDRVVKGRTPLKFRTTGKVKMNQDIVVIGHPSGLPQKVAGGAQVLLNTAANYFQTNLDTFGGNSGSAVFNADNGSVEGILVRGAKDYDQDPTGCRRVHKTTQQITDFSRYGESVSRITDIKTLKYRGLFLKAAQTGNIEDVKKYADMIAEVGIYDNDMNTAMHVAAAKNQVEVLKYLLTKNININAQNSNGETALHLAAFENSKTAIKMLVDNGADTLIKDKFGKLASQRTNYLAFSTRTKLKKVEEIQKKKKKKKNI